MNNFAQIGRRDFHVKRNNASLFNIYVGERKQSVVHCENQSTVNKIQDSVCLIISKRLSVKIIFLKSSFANRPTNPIVSNNLPSNRDTCIFADPCAITAKELDALFKTWSNC